MRSCRWARLPAQDLQRRPPSYRRGMDRYVVDGIESHDEALKAGIAWLHSRALSEGSNSAAIVVPTRNDTRNLSGAIGGDLAHAAQQDGGFTYFGLQIEVLAAKKLPDQFAGPVLVPWASTKIVEEGERMDPPAICVTPWGDDELDEWRRSWGPIDVSTGQAQAAEAPSAAIRGAVKSLPHGDVLHRLDKQSAVDAFKALRMHEREIDPALVRSEAIRRDWSPDAADRLAELAERIAKGVAVRGGTQPFGKRKAKELLDRFEAEPD